VTLFEGAPTELTIRFMSAPSLVAVAAGTDHTGVHYAPPTIAVTAAQGRSYRLDTAGESVDIPLVGPGGCNVCEGDTPVTGVVRISLGSPRERIGHTTVDATAAAVRLQVLGVPGVGALLDATLGDLDVSARVPLGGLTTHQAVSGTSEALSRQQPSPPVPSRSTNVASPPAFPLPGTPSATPKAPPETQSPQPVVPVDRPTLPVTGTNLGVLAALGLGLLGIGWVVLRATRRPR
jgi:LPXTG-motif cell wall-anchored protein